MTPPPPADPQDGPWEPEDGPDASRLVHARLLFAWTCPLCACEGLIDPSQEEPENPEAIFAIGLPAEVTCAWCESTWSPTIEDV